MAKNLLKNQFARKTTQTFNNLQEQNMSFINREDKVNGYSGGASRILVKVESNPCGAVFGTSRCGSTVSS